MGPTVEMLAEMAATHAAATGILTDRPSRFVELRGQRFHSCNPSPDDLDGRRSYSYRCEFIGGPQNGRCMMRNQDDGFSPIKFEMRRARDPQRPDCYPPVMAEYVAAPPGQTDAEWFDWNHFTMVVRFDFVQPKPMPVPGLDVKTTVRNGHVLIGIYDCLLASERLSKFVGGYRFPLESPLLVRLWYDYLRKCDGLTFGTVRDAKGRRHWVSANFDDDRPFSIESLVRADGATSVVAEFEMQQRGRRMARELLAICLDIHTGYLYQGKQKFITDTKEPQTNDICKLTDEQKKNIKEIIIAASTIKRLQDGQKGFSTAYDVPLPYY